MSVVQFFKNLVHKKRFWIAVGVVVVCALMVWAYKAGWRITYAPELETSWECVSAIASLIGAFGTVAAVWSAIRVPKKIAEQQDRISLFEKRYQLFSMLAKWRFLSEQIVTHASNNEDARKFFSMLYAENNDDRLLSQINLTYRYIINEISQVYFLFGIKEEMHPTLLSLINTTATILMDRNLEGQKNQLRETLNCEEIDEIFSIMQKELTISH